MRPVPAVRRRVAHLGGGAVLGRFDGVRELYRGIKDRFAYVITQRGRSEFRFRGKTYEQGPGAIQLKQPGEVYCDLRRDGPATFDVVLLDAAHVESAAGREVGLARAQVAATDPRAAPLVALHDALLGASTSLERDGLIAEAALALVDLAYTGRAEPARDRPLIRRAHAYLRERLAENVRLDELADHVGADKYHLIRAFRAHVGMPPYEFLTHLRIARARELLRAGMAVGAVATEVGYCDQSQLHRHFVRIVGTTPGRFARR